MTTGGMPAAARRQVGVTRRLGSAGTLLAALCCLAAPVGSMAAGGGTPPPALPTLLPSVPKRPPQAPRSSDVVFSPRFERSDAVSAAQAFHATRIEWTYVNRPEALKRLRDAVGGGHLGGTINNNLKTPGNAGAALDIEGQPIVAPWMRSWGAIWNTCAAPDTVQALHEAVRKLLKAGVDSIQFDDPGMQFESESWGAGDFSPSSLAAFGAWVARQPAGSTGPLTPATAADYGNWLRTAHGIRSQADYLQQRNRLPTTALWRRFLREQVEGCLADLRSFVAQESGGRVALTMNIYTPWPWAAHGWLLPYSDYVVSEVHPEHSNAAALQLFAQHLQAQGRPWSPVFKLTGLPELRAAIATAYAHGATPVVPWDVFIAPDASGKAPPRFFARTSDVEDLYALVRRLPTWLDGWETLSRTALFVPAQTPRQLTQALAQLRRLSTAQVPYTVTTTPTAQGPRQLLALFAQGPASEPGVPLLADTRDDTLARLAAASEVTAGVQVVVKGQLARPMDRLVHLVRSTTDRQLGRVQLRLSAWTLPAAASYAVTLARPGQPDQALAVQRASADGSLELSIEMADWALLEIQPAKP